jgi:titin
MTSQGLGSEIEAMIPMRLGPDALDDLVLVADGEVWVMPTAPSATIVVNSPADVPAGGDGACTLREAIENANSNSDTTGGDCAAGTGEDTISFNVLDGGVTATITPASPLPPIADPVVIDGTTQGCASPPCIELNGSLAGATDVDGLQLEVGGNTVRGLVINRFSRHGMLVLSAGNIIEGNYIGTNIAGDTALRNGTNGIRVITGTDNTIGGTTIDARNLISGNGGAGLQLRETSTANLVTGNYIGTDIGGTVDLGNSSGVGILLDSDGNTIGGTQSGEGNLISGNETLGINVQADSDMNLVQGNMVGTNASGTAAVGNISVGIWVQDGAGNSIGGTALGARNLVSGNTSAGVLIAEVNAVPTTGNLVQGNFIGTNESGSSAVPNSLSGVIIGANENIVGGIESARNIISGNGENGVFIVTRGNQMLPPAEGNQVLNNYIGTDVTGSVALGNGFNGVTVQDSRNNVIGGADDGAGNLISANTFNGIVVSELADMPLGPATGNLIQGNLVGTDASGQFDLGNGFRGIIPIRAPGNTIGGSNPGEGNVIAGNGTFGISNVDSDGTIIEGNLIGVNATGMAAVGNDRSGIILQDSSGCRIGGTSPGAGNVVSGNGEDGVNLFQTAQGVGTDNTVQGNFIGTDITGTVDLGNSEEGLDITGPTDNMIGGETTAARNIISGNGAHGVKLRSTSGNRVQGNYIGTDVTGQAALGNDFAGVRVFSASNNLIGGPVPGAGNYISSSGMNGVDISSDSFLNVVQGNYIGTGANNNDGALGNVLAGVSITDSSTNTIGGINPGEGNVIGYNGAEGVVVQGVVAENAILGNSISENGLLGIDLGADGVTTNDPDDPDLGPNLLQNFPELSLAEASPVDLLLEGTLNSISRTDFRLEFFANAVCDGSLHGEGQRLLAFLDVSTTGTGTADFSMVFPAQVSDGASITATATDADGNTSEFSACLAASCTTIVTFAQTVVAPGKDALTWPMATDVFFAKGNLVDVSTYATVATGPLFAATGYDISGDSPAPGAGLYYVFKPLGCGSWQTVLGDEPGRDTGLP